MTGTLIALDSRSETTAADRAVMTGTNLLEQDVWWTGRDGITRLIDDLADDHRRFIARMLIDNAAKGHARIRRHQLFWLDALNQYHEGGIEYEYLTAEAINDTIRREQERGDHLVEVRDSPLFRKMVQGLDWVHAGVTEGVR